jgi:hypothetical protein
MLTELTSGARLIRSVYDMEIFITGGNGDYIQFTVRGLHDGAKSSGEIRTMHKAIIFAY